MSISYGFIALAVSSFLILGASTNGIKKFGCQFKNAEYELQSDNTFAPVFGNKIQPLVLKSNADFKNLKDQIEAINQVELNNNIYNSLDIMLDFFDAYAKCNKTEFEPFFKSYKIKFSKQSPASGLAISALDGLAQKLKSKWPTIANHIFLGALQKDLYLTKRKYNTLDKAFITAMDGKNIKLTVPILKFSLNNDIGYYLLDPTHGLEFPIALKENGPIPDTCPDAMNNAGQPLVYELHPNKKFITVKYTQYQDHEILRLEHLIYVDEPFCSAIGLTEKIDLLSIEKFIEKRISNGDPAAGLLVRIFSISEANEFDDLDDDDYSYNDELDEKDRIGLETKNQAKDGDSVVDDSNSFPDTENAASKRILLYVKKEKMENFYINPFEPVSLDILQNTLFKEVAQFLGYTKEVLFAKIKRAAAMIQHQQFLNSLASQRDIMHTLKYYVDISEAATPMTIGDKPKR